MGDSESEAQEEGSSSSVDKYNVESAELLANTAQGLPITQSAPLFEQLLLVFPTCARFWKQYVEAYMAVNNDEATKQIFSRCLLNCLHVPLWRCYIQFIRRAYEKKGAEGQEETKKAFNFLLSYVGEDITAGPLWMEYIAFLKSLPAQNALEETQRMTAVRKSYQKAIITPTHHVEQLWKDYENFENSVSRQLAKGLVSEYQPKYTSARAVYRERKKYVDEIDWNMLPVPPIGSSKEEQQWIAWKRYLTFEKGNPQRIDSATSNQRIILTYEQCLMYLCHYPDIWYDYATWHAKSGSIDTAVKIYQRALKALPDSEMLKYAYAELEESRGAIQAAKKVYESLLGDDVNATALAHIQFVRFLRRNEGVEAARKYFLDARKSPNCTYHVYVAYAMMAHCLDKEPKVAHNIFEAGLKRFMHEPAYVLEYADFLSRLNDDRNIRALFERALSSLQLEESTEVRRTVNGSSRFKELMFLAEVWKRFAQFEQTYGDLASMLKVEQRRKEALSKANEEGVSAIDASLQDIISRYSFMDLWPCSAKDLDHLARQEWLAKNITKKAEKSVLSNVGVVGNTSNSSTSANIIYPDISRMMVYDPRKKTAEAGVSARTTAAVLGNASNPLPSSTTGVVSSGSTNTFDEILKTTSPALLSFLETLPVVEGPAPNVDVVISICLQNDVPSMQASKQGKPSALASSIPTPATSDLSGSSRSHAIPSGSSFKPRQGSNKRKDLERQEEDESATVQSQPVPRDVFKMRQIQKSRVGSTSQTGSTSYGSALSGDLSASTG